MVADLSRRRWSVVRRLPSGVALVALLALVALPLVRSPSAVTVNVGEAGALDGAESPREQTASITVTNAAAVALRPSAYAAPTSGHCIASTVTPVYVVVEGAANTTGADGPYCTDAAACPAGAVIPIGGRAWARLASGGPVTLACRFRDGGSVGAALAPRGASGGGAPADPACELTGGADCIMTGPVRLPDGTTASAAVQFSSQANVGIRRPVFNSLALVAGGYDIVTVGASNVHIDSAITTTATSFTGRSNGTSFTNIGVLRSQGGGGAAYTLNQPMISRTADNATGWSPGLNITGGVTFHAQTHSVNGVGALQIGGGTTATATRIIGANDSVNVAVLHLPRSVSSTAVPPDPTITCDVGTSGMMTYYDDANDTVRGKVCVCTSLGGTPETYGWRDVSDMTTTCT